MTKFNLLLLSFCFALFACNSTHPDLKRAENVLLSSPDSALKILKSIPNSNSFDPENHALYALLMTWAIENNDIGVENDSLIRIATDYFNDNNPKRAGWAWLLRSRIYDFGSGDQSENAKALLKAQKFANQSSDKLLNLCIADDKARIFIIQSQYDSALYYFRATLKGMEELKSERNCALVLIEIGSTLSDQNKLDSCIFYFKKAERIANKINESLIYANIYNSLSTLYLKEKNYYQTIYYALKSPITNMKDINAEKWYNLSKAYYEIGKLDSSRYYLRNIKDNYRFIASDFFRLLKNICEKEGNQNEANRYAIIIVQTEDSIKNKKLKTKYDILENKYKFQNLELENKNLELKNNQQKIYFLFYLFGLSVCVLGAVLWRNKVRKKELTFQSKIIQNDKILFEKEKENNQLLELQLKVQRILLLNVEQYKKNSINQTIKDIDLKSTLFHDELITCMDIKYNNISKRLKNSYPELSDRDILVCCLLLSDFETNMIATILDVKNETILILRSRLRKKLSLKNSENLVLFLSNF